MIAYMFIGILLILVSLLFIPLKFEGLGSLASDISADIHLTWAGGLVSSHWHLAPSAASLSTFRVGPWILNQSNYYQRSPIPKKSNKSGPNHVNWEYIKTCLNKQVWRELHLFLSKIWQSLCVRGTLTGEFGTDDPAITGYIYALIAMFSTNGFTLRLTPQFADTILKLDGDINGRIIPGIIIMDLGLFMFKKPIRNIWFTLLHNRNKETKRRMAYV